jgi:hypothetical protein
MKKEIVVNQKKYFLSRLSALKFLVTINRFKKIVA